MLKSLKAATAIGLVAAAVTAGATTHGRQRDAFQSFNRLGRESSTVAGLGLGLAIASRLTQAMKGEIGFESREGAGSRFWVRFPAT